MTKEQINKISKEIEDISNNFESEPWTENMKLLKDDFDINTIKSPKRYLEIMGEISEIFRETRVMFLHSVFNKVCQTEGELYSFSTPYQAGMKYSAVMKKEGIFYILDEDGQYREMFTTEKFTRFVDDQYWELVEE